MLNDKKNPQTSPEDPNTNITPEERALLDESMENSLSVDNTNLKNSALDTTDADGILLNEGSADLTGEDLDVPGAELDDANEKIGEEDEENNVYSPADTE